MNLRKVKFNITWEVFFAIGVFSLFLLHMLKLIAPLRANDLYNTYGIVAIAALSAIYFYKKGLSGPWEVKLFIAYVAWVLLTRWLNKDFYLLVDFKFVMMVMMSFLFFAVGTVLNNRQREILLDVLSIVYGGFFVIMSILGIFITVTNTYIHLPPENVWITLKGDSYLQSLNLLSSPTAIGAGRVYIAWALLIYQIIKRKNKYVKALLIICVIVLHITIPLFHCRNLQIVLPMSYGMLVLLYALKHTDKKSKAFKAFILPIITSIVFVICFLSFNWMNSFVSKTYDFAAPRFEVFYDGLDNKLNPDYFGIVLTSEELAELSETNLEFSKTDYSVQPLRAFVAGDSAPPSQLSAAGKMTDSRNIFENITLTGRTSIWQSGIIALEENPIICIRGTLTNVYMDIVNAIRQELINTSRTMSHMHNAYFQVLMITGIPGLFLIVFWTILMIKNMLKVFFSKYINLSLKVLTIPIAGILVFNLAEVVIFGMIDMIGVIFFTLAGIFIGFHKAQFSD